MFDMRGMALVLVASAALAVAGPALASPPANDDFGAPAELNGRIGFASGTNVEATKEVGEPDHAGDPGGASVWYRWIAPAAGRVTVSTCDSDFDTVLAVYTGVDVGDLDEIAANDDECGEQSRLSFQAVGGTAYRIAVDGGASDVGDIALALNLAPPNDNFADAQVLAGDTGSSVSTNVGASSEAGEPPHYGVGFNSVWFRWTAPSSGWATFETCGSDFDTVLAVYTGSDLTGLTEVGGNDDACGYSSRLAFEAAAGTMYVVAVAGYDGEAGEIALAWNRNAPPPTAPGAIEYPRITGLAREGETLTVSDGRWAGTQPITFSYAWGRCDRDFDSCALIPGAQSRTYVAPSADVGYRLFARVTATNVAGSTPAFSVATAPVLARAPINTVVPLLSGQPILGALLVATSGEWTGTAPISLTYQWQICDAVEVVCTDLAGQAGPVMRVGAAAMGGRLRVVVTATNPGGSASAASDATGAVRRAQVRRCVVPNVKRKPVAVARRAIRRAGCATGRVRSAYSARVGRGRVISQSPRPGARVRAGAKVTLVLSRGRKR